VTIGNFDGVHLGHRYLLTEVVAAAEARGVPACVFTFDPPPRAVLEPDRCPPRITSLDDKIDLLGEVGIAQVVVETFDLEFAAQSAEWFAHEILARRLRPAALVVGHDFRFGRKRSGTVAELTRLLPGLEVREVDVMTMEGTRPSSSRIREAVAEGRVTDAAAMLGRNFGFSGEVVHGDRRGRTIGYPTANIRPGVELLPANGVYAVRAQVDGRWLPGVANLGIRPTFEGRRYQVEVHLFDFDGDLYGRQLPVRFIDYIRGEQRFDGVEALVAQIRADAARARELLEAPQPS
jgi:riboflavin kinase/FMN adenylyltransferase